MYTKVLCPRILYAPSAVRILLYLRSRTNTEKIKKDACNASFLF